MVQASSILKNPWVLTTVFWGAPLEGRASARPQSPDVRKLVPPEETFKKIGLYMFVEIYNSSILKWFLPCNFIIHYIPFMILLLGQMIFSGSTKYVGHSCLTPKSQDVRQEYLTYRSKC